MDKQLSTAGQATVTLRPHGVKAARSSALDSQFRYWSPWLIVFLALWLFAFLVFAQEPYRLFERNWTFILVGFGGALLGNISAVGGGIVFIPVMIFLFRLSPVAALKVALASQSFGMTSGAVGWLQKIEIPVKALKIAVPGLLIGSTVSSLLIHPSALIVKVLFGPVSILLGILTIVLSGRTATASRRDIPDEAGAALFAASIFGGLITGWVAIGEGEIVAAFLMLAYGVEAATCIGLGVILLSVNSIYLSVLHQLFLGGIPWDIAAFTGLGCVFGARLAPWLGHYANATALKTVFAAIAISDGVLFVVQYIVATGR